MVALPKGRLHQFNIITETIIKQQNDEGFLHRLPDETEFPLLDFFETINDFVIKVDLPGIDKKDVNIKLYGDTAVIEGVKRDRIEEERFNFICMERSFENFRRIIRLPLPINPFTAKARYEDGVLTVMLPKIEEKRKREIKIEIEGGAR